MSLDNSSSCDQDYKYCWHCKRKCNVVSVAEPQSHILLPNLDTHENLEKVVKEKQMLALFRNSVALIFG